MGRLHNIVAAFFVVQFVVGMAGIVTAMALTGPPPLQFPVKSSRRA